MYQKIEACRLCRDTQLDFILSLGNQSFTGIFTRNPKEAIPQAPLEIVKCRTCHLVQLAHNFDSKQLYGQTYGYRSGLNQSMVRHLRNRVALLLQKYQPAQGDLILDIGSNDSTLLQSYPEGKFTLVGIDPTGVKFKNYYPPSIQLIPDFFSAHLVTKAVKGKKAKIITSIAMFYDLNDPLGFAQEIADVLDDEGVWLFEQSYLPTMLERLAYDTICHEHLEYYGLRQIHWITERAGLKIIDLEFNDVNGGSFTITAAKKGSRHAECTELVQAALKREEELGLHTMAPYLEFRRQIERHRDELIELLAGLKRQGKTVFGYGASTKGNVLLQYCGLTPDEIPYIAEVNEEKFGAFTPGSHIPIISEADARGRKPDCLLVLPWHFRKGILERETSYLAAGGKMLFPLPRIELVSASAT